MKRTQIRSIRQAQNGNYLINGQSNSPIWVNGGEMRSLLLGYNLDPNSPAMLLIGSFITYDEKIITQDDINNGTNQVKLAVPRTIRTGEKAGEIVSHITYKTPGAKQFNFGFEPSDRLWGVVAEQSVKKTLEKNEAAAEERLGRRSLTSDEDVSDDIIDNELLNNEQPENEETPENQETPTPAGVEEEEPTL